MNESRFKNYLYDLGTIVAEKAIHAKRSALDNDDAYSVGYLMALHEMVSLMQSQAKQFDISLQEVGLEGLNPEIDLL